MAQAARVDTHKTQRVQAMTRGVHVLFRLQPYAPEKNTRAKLHADYGRLRVPSPTQRQPAPLTMWQTQSSSIRMLASRTDCRRITSLQSSTPVGMTQDGVLTRYQPRAEFTSRKAIEFLHECKVRKPSFEPIGVVQSWSPRSATTQVMRLVEVGFTSIALGGLAARPTTDI